MDSVLQKPAKLEPKPVRLNLIEDKAASSGQNYSDQPVQPVQHSWHEYIFLNRIFIFLCLLVNHFMNQVSVNSHVSPIWP